MWMKTGPKTAENKLPTRNDKFTESSIIKAYWAQWDSLKLINGCLYRNW